MLKKRRPGFLTVAVELASSAVLSGAPRGSHRIRSIGAGFIPQVLRMELVDKFIQGTDEGAIDMARRLAKEEGLLCGISSGAAAWTALQVARRSESEYKRIVVIFPDTGERYLSTDLFERKTA